MLVTPKRIILTPGTAQSFVVDLKEQAYGLTFILVDPTFTGPVVEIRSNIFRREVKPGAAVGAPTAFDPNAADLVLGAFLGTIFTVATTGDDPIAEPGQYDFTLTAPSANASPVTVSLVIATSARRRG